MHERRRVPSVLVVQNRQIEPGAFQRVGDVPPQDARRVVLVHRDPAHERRERLDARRAQDLQVISQAIGRYEATHERLPATLDELQRGSDIQVVITDPVTLEPYGYETGEGAAYELCAVFELATTTTERELRRGRRFSRREAGRHCFQLRAERDRLGPIASR